MKKIISIAVLTALLFTSLFLFGCDKEDGGKDVVNDKDGSMTVTNLDGEKVKIDFKQDKDISSYSIARSDKADKEVIAVVTQLRKNLEAKLGVALDIKTNIGGADAKRIVVEVDSSFGGNEYQIVSRDGKIYIKGGSAESLGKAADLFVSNFAYKTDSSFLHPLGDGLFKFERYFFEKLTVDGVALSEFNFYSDPENETVINGKQTYFSEIITYLNEQFNDNLIGKTLEVTKTTRDKHCIIISCNSLNVNDYSIEFKDGHIYITGSALSAVEAAKVFVSEILGYKDGVAEFEKTLDLTSKNDLSGKTNYTAPYTKDALLAMLREAADRDDMVLAGTHTYGAAQNGSGIRNTAEKTIEHAGEAPAILEIDLGQFSPYNTLNGKGGTLTKYDMSVLVSEGAEHVSKGGVVAMVCHFANPLENASDNVWYRGQLGGDDILYEMIKEGTELNEKFRVTIKDSLDVLKAFTDNDITIIFRPFHEINGNWFWWCVDQGGGRFISEKGMHDLWIYLYDIVNDELGATNHLWSYSTTGNGDGRPDVLYAYPGPEYVDLVGLDWYTSGKKEYNNADTYTMLESTGHPAALTEYGPSDGLSKKDIDGNTYFEYTGIDMFEDIQDMIDNGHSVAYFLTWVGGRSLYDITDSDRLMKESIIFSREDMAKYWAEK